MKTITDFAVIAAPLTFAALALLFVGRRHIYRQMDQIAEASTRRAEDCSCDKTATLHLK